MNPDTQIRCVIDGATDFNPYWIRDDEETLDKCEDLGVDSNEVIQLLIHWILDL